MLGLGLPERAGRLDRRDRSEVLLGVLTAHTSATFPSISGIVLNGGFPLSDAVERLLAVQATVGA
uniref:hypothetical protein n=1 Tax=Agromyces humi TaxID=1766800 RepID=UPI001F43EEE9